MTQPAVAAGPVAVETPANPFRELRTRTLVPWVIVGTLVLYLAFGVVSLLSPIDLRDPATGEIVAMMAGYGALATWVAWVCRHSGVSVRRLVGRVPEGHKWLPALGILIATVAFSSGSWFVIAYGLSHVAPGLLGWLLETIESVPDGTIAYHMAWIVVAVLVAPVLEEVVFRGVLLSRWGFKWGIRKAIIASAVLFGFLHANVIGIAMVGLITAILYFQTRTLIVPMAFHAANNLGATVAGYALDSGEPMDVAAEIQGIRSDVWLGVALVAITLPVLVWYIRRHWPSSDAVLPYLASDPAPDANG